MKLDPKTIDDLRSVLTRYETEKGVISKTPLQSTNCALGCYITCYLSCVGSCYVTCLATCRWTGLYFF